MKQYQMNMAWRTLRVLANEKMPIKASYRIAMLLKQMEPNIMAQSELERKVALKYPELFDAEGKLMIPDKDNKDAVAMMEQYSKDLHELNNEECQMEIKPIKMTFDEFGYLPISPADLMNLDGFIEFE